jgi:uncharacterized protein YecT (DUF1311 family)
MVIFISRLWVSIYSSLRKKALFRFQNDLILKWLVPFLGAILMPDRPELVAIATAVFSVGNLHFHLPFPTSAMHKRLIHAFILVAITLLSILVSPTLALATPQEVNPVFRGRFAIAQLVNCSTAETTVELKYCSQQSYKAADKQLNQIYQQVISTTRGQQKQLLIAAEQAWIDFRDNNCNFETFLSRNGTGYEIFRNGCLERLTKQRTKELQNYLSER